MSNRELRVENKSVHVLLALARPVHGEKSSCIRSVDKGMGDEVDILEAKLKVIGGYWRIHRTVNARDVEKARKWLISKLIYHPEKASYIDSEWRTALLQPEHIYGLKKFMLDVDFKDKLGMHRLKNMISEKNGTILAEYESPQGYHLITNPFDTREVCRIKDVTLIRDGYYFLKEVGKKETKDNGRP